MEQLWHFAIDARLQRRATRFGGHRFQVKRRKIGGRAIGQNGVSGHHIIRHHAVENAVTASGIVAHATADGGAICAGGVWPQHQFVRAQLAIEHGYAHAGLCRRGFGLGIDRHHIVHILTKVNDDRRANGLPGQRTAAAARQDRYPMTGGNLDRRLHIVGIFGNDHPHRLDLVEAGVGAVEHPGCLIKAHFPFDLGL